MALSYYFVGQTLGGNAIIPGTPTFSAGALFSDGAVGSPSIAFANHTTTGLFWDSGHGGGLAFANQGVEFMYFDNTNTGIVLRPGGGTGVLLTNLGTNQLYIRTGDSGSYTNINCNAVNIIGRTSTAANCGLQNNAAGSGVYGDASTCGLATSGASGLLMDTNQRISMIKPQVATKTQAVSPVTLAAADSFTQFDNAGASGGVTFNLPSAVLGLTYTFCLAAAQAITVTPQAADAIGAKAAAASVTTGAPAKGQYLKLTCTSANYWSITSNNGFA